MSLETALALLAALLVSCGGAMLLTPLAGRLGAHLGLVDRPRPGEVQMRAVPRSGGYGLIVAFLLAVGLSLALVPRSGPETSRILGLVIGIILVLPVAALDDARRLGPVPQLIGQIVLSLVALGFGLIIDTVANPFGGLIALPLVVAAPFTVFWIVGMINTLNWIDTIDGLAAGVTAIAATVLFARSVLLGQYTISLLPLALAGVCLGFLRFNFEPARIIMGSSGATFLGFALAVLALIGGAKIATAAFVLGLPILDVAMVILYRSLRRRSPFIGGDDAHLTHRLVRRGLSVRRITLSVYGICAVGGMLAMTLNGVQKLWVIAIVLAGAAVLAVRLAAAPTAE